MKELAMNKKRATNDLLQLGTLAGRLPEIALLVAAVAVNPVLNFTPFF